LRDKTKGITNRTAGFPPARNDERKFIKTILMTAAGGPDVLQLCEVAKPELPSPHHVLVKLAAAGVNPLDTKLRAKPVYYPDNLPAILGCDGAGLVAEIGSAVTRFKTGDAVYFCNGGWAGNLGGGRAATPNTPYCTRNIVRRSATCRWSAALRWCCSPWESLVARQPAGRANHLIQPPRRGVGHIAVCRPSPRRIYRGNRGQRQGSRTGAWPRRGKIIRYKEQDFVRETLDWTGGKGADVVFDTVGGETFCAR
jgi:NADPH2:quinone reductase